MEAVIFFCSTQSCIRWEDQNHSHYIIINMFYDEIAKTLIAIYHTVASLFDQLYYNFFLLTINC